MVDPLQSVTIDEALGLRALAALLDGDLDGAVEVLAAARRGYRLAFLCRLAVVVPSVALRLSTDVETAFAALGIDKVERPARSPRYGAVSSGSSERSTRGSPTSSPAA